MYRELIEAEKLDTNLYMVNVMPQNNDAIIWINIKWKKEGQIVNNLRQRIYRASANGDIKRVRNLQKLMMRSQANVLVSIRRVTQQNHGKNTPGVDKVIIRTATERIKLYLELIKAVPGKGYPIKRVYIPKKKGKRPLGLPIIFDRCMQAIVKNALEPYWEAHFETSSYGFRPGRSTHDAIEKIAHIASVKNTRKWVLDADIKGAFDNINHDYLLSCIKGFPGIKWIKQWLKSGVMEDMKYFPTITGVPQGSIVSPLLANIALHGMEKTLGVKYREYGYLSTKCCALVRYADDFVVLHETKQGCEIAKQTLQTWLAQRGLELSPEKTHIKHLTQGFDFLGFNIRYYPVKNRKQPYIFLAKPSKSSISQFRSKFKQAWKQIIAWPIKQGIEYLNPKIVGWGNYFRIGTAKKTFANLDSWMWLRQTRFVTRRHPNKSWQWKSKYWGIIPQHHDKWVFKDKDSKQYLEKLSWISIKRHILVKGKASPDNPELREYWRERQLRKIDVLSSAKIRTSLWKQQKGLCLICNQPLDNGEDTHCHHKRPKKQGGSNRIDNLCLLHSLCHHQVHSKQNNTGASRLLEPCAG